ncbi:MAG: YqeG family HAD IIIA-type phosphatase [Clostridia bacterium]|nr:YqeG family HAD IIIA-type phosphatase [Clostridia bacterium]
MFKKLYPDLIVDRIQDIELETLIKKNIKGLILDIDNTLVPQHMKEADENAVRWIEKVRKAGFKTCIVSNASEKRVIKFNERLKVFAIHRASKPGTKAFMRAARLMDIKISEAAVIGDQIFTDVYGGNKAGAFTVLVKPIDKKEFVFVRFKRIFEKPVLMSYRRKYHKKR